jgi:hypothetical protein
MVTPLPVRELRLTRPLFVVQLTRPFTSENVTLPKLLVMSAAPPTAHQGDGTDLPAAYHLPGVMVNQQDASMGFRKDLRFTPYAVLGNTTRSPMAVTLKASFDVMDGTGLQHADLPLPVLAPLETRVLDFSQYLKSKLLPAASWTSPWNCCTRE